MRERGPLRFAIADAGLTVDVDKVVLTGIERCMGPRERCVLDERRGGERE